MGRVLLVSRLVIGDIKRRRVQSAMLLVMIATATTTLTLGLTLHHVSHSQFARTRAATRGPDVVAEVGYDPGSSRPSAKQLAPLLHGPGIAGTAGPYPVALVRLTSPRINVPVQAEGRDLAPAAIDRPLLVAGHWVAPGGAVLEQGLADSLHLHIGDAIRLGGHSLRVAGIAVTAAQPFYPARVPGLVWLTRTNAEQLATRSQPLGFLLDIKLTNPASTTAFGNSSESNAFGRATSNEPSILEPWQHVRTDDYRVIGLDQKVLLIGSLLLSMLAIASVAVVVGGRMAEQTRRVGLLKAVGGTPTLVAIVLLSENLLLALAAAVLGLVAGDLLAPLARNRRRRSRRRRRDTPTGDPRGTHDHDQSTQRSSPPAAATAVVDRDLGCAAGAAAAGTAPRRASHTPDRPHRRQPDDRGHDGRHRADRPTRPRGHLSAADAGRVLHQLLDRHRKPRPRHAQRDPRDPRRDQRDLHRLGDRNRRAEVNGPRARSRRHTPTDQRGTDGRSTGSRACCGLCGNSRRALALRAGRREPIGRKPAAPMAPRGDPRHPDRRRRGNSNPRPDRRPSLGRRGTPGRIDHTHRTIRRHPRSRQDEPRIIVRLHPALRGERDRFGSPAVIGLVESMTDSRLAIRRTRSAARGDPASVAAPAMARPMNLALDRGLIMCGQGRTTATD